MGSLQLLACCLAITLCLLHGTTAQSADTAALIIGGYWIGHKGGPVLNKVELFGCTNNGIRDSIPVANYPFNVYLSAGNYIQDGDKVMQCGGYFCTDKTCGISNACYTWTPETEWTQAAPMTANRWAHLLPQVPNINKTSSAALVPLAIGLNVDTEIFDPATNTWSPYLNLKPEHRFWYSIGCFAQHMGKIYSMRDNVFELDPATWTTTDFGAVPTAHANSGRCAPLTINGDPGILTRYGYWFNIRTRTWHAKAPPPYPPTQLPPNSIWSFRGKPTVFGSPVCDANGANCKSSGVIQYDAATDSWASLGEMLEARAYHEVIEVPRSYCDRYKPVKRDSAAIVLGGFWSGAADGNVLKSVELFGCAGSGSIALTPYPHNVYLTAGSYRSVGDDVYVCGGYFCDASACGITRECYTWTPTSNQWTRTNPLTKARWAHLMAHVPNLNSNTSTGLVPMVMGLNLDTEIYDPVADQWTAYRPIEDRNWYTISCFMQYEGKVYNLRQNLMELDPSDWTKTDFGAVPTAHANLGKCAGLTINGEIGIMTRYGYWYNLHRRSWHLRSPPPYAQGATAPNAMFTFRGRPTIFGNPECDGNVTTCHNTGVVQYNPDTNSWVRLGSLLESRSFHEVIEVPAEYCDTFVSTTTTTTPATTTTPKTTTTTARTTTTTVPGQTSTTTTSAGQSLHGPAFLIVMFNLLIMCKVY